MRYYTTSVKVRSGSKALQFFIVEDLTDQRAMYTLEPQSCDWFDAISVGNILQVLARSDGTVHSVIKLITEPLEVMYDDDWGLKREKRF